MVKVKQEVIYCPKCGTKIMGSISELRLGPDMSFPFLDYHAYCPDCDYFVTESEWETEEEYRKMFDGKVALKRGKSK